MSLELAFRRLAIQPKAICHSCRRAFVSSARLQEQQSATGAFHDSLQVARTNTRHPSRPAASTAAATLPPPSNLPSNPSSTPTSPGAPSAAQQLAYDTIRSASAASMAKKSAIAAADALREYSRTDLELQVSRRWKASDVYAPHDLTGVEMNKWKKTRRKPRPRHGDVDVMDQLGMNPLDHYKNFSIMAEYVTEMGRIRHSNDTGLRPVNQRRMAKAIRRAIGVGLIPSVYRHPELLRAQLAARQSRGQ